MPLTARQLSTLELKDQLALIYGQFVGEPLSRNQFNNLDTFNDKITAIYLELAGATLTRHFFSLLTRNEQMSEIYIALGGTKKRQAIIGYDLSSQLANIYIVCPDPILTIRQFKALSLDMQMAHIYLAVGRVAVAEPAAPPINTVAPAASGGVGGPRAGVEASVTEGTWVPDGTKTYQWQVSDDGIAGWVNSAITGNQSPAITPDGGMQDKYIKCIVTATNDDGFASADSDVLGPITAE